MSDSNSATVKATGAFLDLDDKAGTGVIFSPQHVLTAGHIVYDKITNSRPLFFSVEDSTGTVSTGDSNISILRNYDNQSFLSNDLAYASFASGSFSSYASIGVFLDPNDAESIGSENSLLKDIFIIGHPGPDAGGDGTKIRSDSYSSPPVIDVNSPNTGIQTIKYSVSAGKGYSGGGVWSTYQESGEDEDILFGIHAGRTQSFNTGIISPPRGPLFTEAEFRNFIELIRSTGATPEQLPRYFIFGSAKENEDFQSFAGTEFRDVLVGGEGDEEIVGGEADDEIHGGDGNDILYGDLILTEESKAGNDILNGGEGIDAAVYEFDVTESNDGIAVTFATSMTPDETPILNVTDPYGNTDILISIEKVVGTNNDDTFNVEGLDNQEVTFEGLGGNDVITLGDDDGGAFGGGGVDTITGGSGDDTIGNINSPSFEYDDFTAQEIQDIIDSEDAGEATTLSGGAGNDIYFIDYSSEFESNDPHGAVRFVIDDTSTNSNKLFVRDITTGEIDILGGDPKILKHGAFTETDETFGDGQELLGTCTTTKETDQYLYLTGANNAIYVVGVIEGDLSFTGSECDGAGGEGEPQGEGDEDPLDAPLFIRRYDSKEQFRAQLDGNGSGEGEGGDAPLRLIITSDQLSYNDLTRGGKNDLGIEAGLDTSEEPELSDGVTSSPMAAGFSITGTSLGDFVSSTAGEQIATLQEGDDIATTGDRNDTIDGGAGNDSLTSAGGDDEVIGGSGDDTVLAGAGSDTVSGDDGQDFIQGEGGSDFISGGLGVDTLRGGDDRDYILGGGGDDYLYGEAGLDSLVGGVGDDFYTIVAGEGNDRIIETDIGSDGLSGSNVDTDRITLTGYDVASTELIRDLATNDLIIRDINSGQKTTVVDQFAGDAWGVEQILFDDGSIWNSAFIDANAIDATLGAEFNGTSANELINGAALDDTISGLAGDDTLKGNSGSDTYLFSANDGSDVLNDKDGSAADNDQIIFDASVSASDLVFSRSGDTASRLFITNSVTGAQIEIRNQFASNNPDGNGIELISFSDGTFLDRDAIFEQTTLYVGSDAGQFYKSGSNDDDITGGLGDDTLRGEAGSDTYRLSATDGNDFINDIDGFASDIDRIVFDSTISATDLILSRNGETGQKLFVTNSSTGDIIEIQNQFDSSNPDGNGIEEFLFSDGTVWDRATIAENTNLFTGATDSDFYTGTSNADDITGGLGDDTLKGEGGSDTYHMSSSDGADFINDQNGSAVDVDRIIFDASVATSDLELSQNGEFAQKLFITNTITGSVVEVQRQFASDNPDSDGIEEFVFVDGTVWDRATIAANTNLYVGKDDDEFYTGTANDDDITGAGGDDTLRGEAGSDTYRFSAVHGLDYINERNGSLVDVDRLSFDTSVSPTDILLALGPDDDKDLIVINTFTGSQIEVNRHFKDNIKGIEEIVFADGTVWDQTQIETMANANGQVVILDDSGEQTIVSDAPIRSTNVSNLRTQIEEILASEFDSRDFMVTDHGEDRFDFSSFRNSEPYISMVADMMELFDAGTSPLRAVNSVGLQKADFESAESIFVPTNEFQIADPVRYEFDEFLF